eukprot:CAMPEP_0203745710 /NCGR_PEP_ID=MMETSP0098-20131031/1364_1 /ASSEMBLY_ACC=CAM_ASM_000208 /TAXON_ID=96639 /ORGANISM=" , Strain NY0313808BC1" /LENGTH=486 /DNA_ID=CAMNT_0050633565 /DNA_START=82 /DNA_END=1542 /DNA_ORIENTATION=-
MANATLTAAEVQSMIDSALATYATTVKDTFLTKKNATQLWVLIAGFLVFFMHAGFSVLENGSVRKKSAINILFKNLGTIAIGGFFYYLLGYGFAYGVDNENKGSHRFIGSGNYALHDETNSTRHSWFFQFAFAATAATIVSGAVAGRINLMGYFITAAFMTAFVYPVVSHWIWANGWLSAFIPYEDSLFGKCNMIDYAGSTVVHLTGGIAALCGAVILGPRNGRFDSSGNVLAMPPHNVTMQALGVFILWFGWYGFNCGSTLAFDGPNASKVAVTTTLSPSMAVLTSMVASRIAYGHYDIGCALNCALAGLVAITAGCSVVDDWAALIIGFLSTFVYMGSSKLMLKLKIDDPVDAISVHGSCGILGTLMVGCFATPANIKSAYDRDCAGWNDGYQFATQLIGVISVMAWVCGLMIPCFLLLKVAGLLRVDAEHEEKGLDVSEHGGQTVFGEPDVADPYRANQGIKPNGESHNDIEKAEKSYAMTEE